MTPEEIQMIKEAFLEGYDIGFRSGLKYNSSDNMIKERNKKIANCKDIKEKVRLTKINGREYGQCPHCGEKDLISSEVTGNFRCNNCEEIWDEVDDDLEHKESVINHIRPRGKSSLPKEHN